jgi:hypothetical protein
MRDRAFGKASGIAFAIGLFACARFDVALAIPAFARQTEQQCIACHVSFPELTPYGRFFKLGGYTIGKAAIAEQGIHQLPLAVMAEASITSTRNNHEVDPDTGETVSVNPRNNGLVFSGASLFLAGKATDWLGGFIQWVYDNLATSGDGTLAYFSTTGSADAGLYGTDADGNARKPDRSGYIVELDYLPIQNVHLLLQYSAYNKFNGASINYNGLGRNARDNNTLFFDLWLAF